MSNQIYPLLNLMESNHIDSLRESKYYNYQVPLKPQQTRLTWYILLIFPLCTMGAQLKFECFPMQFVQFANKSLRKNFLKKS